MNQRLLIIGVGTGDGANVGESFLRAAPAVGWDARLIDYRTAFAGPKWWRAIHWRLFQKRPSALGAFQRQIRSALDDYRPSVILVAGMIPVSRSNLQEVNRRGIPVISFPTDDPWNVLQRSNRYLESIPDYRIVFTPRQSNRADFVRAGAKDVRYLPFGYDELMIGRSAAISNIVRPDVLFVGGGDPERIALIRPLIEADFHVTLCGGYWDRDPVTKTATLGVVEMGYVNALTSHARVNLCLVRRSNRDGHVMRSFEMAALGACIMAEETDEHRTIFGDTVRYFSSTQSLIDGTRTLLNDPELQSRLSAACRERIIHGRNTYRDRLAEMLSALNLHHVESQTLGSNA